MNMRVVVNGEQRQLRVGSTLADVIASLQAAPGGRGLAVALDGEVVPRGAWSVTELRDGAAVEIVVAVQGG
jgi:sulfur carrier protein